ncbi:Protocadherin-like wing polarity protein stan [Nymphon striatum]|nr:Protocadherin-like wing polarity protein stan [Nymphon striatum]
MSTCNQRSKATELFALIVLFVAIFLKSSHGYETQVKSEKKANIFVFNASLSDRGRVYSIGDGPRSGGWTDRIFRLDPRSGSLVAKVCSNGQHLLYVKSRTNRLNADQITTVVFPMYVTLDCGNLSKSIFKTNDLARETAVSVILNNRPHKYGGLCYKKSQVVTSVKSTIPVYFLQKCRVKYRTTNDVLFAIEKRNGDLAVVEEHCFYNPWYVTVLYEIQCRGDRAPSKHSIHFEFSPRGNQQSGEEIPRRVKRQANSRFGGNRPPHFDRPLYAVSVPEEKDKGFVVLSMNAEDPEGNQVDYSILAVLDSRSQHMFDIDMKSGVVTTTVKLDREFMDMHYFRVIAVDEGIPSQTATTTLQVRVQDVNDHVPTFEQNVYEATVKESVPSGTIVVTVRATDRDAGNNAKIVYSILNPGGPNEAFSIDKETGVMVTKLKLDRESNEYYSIKVQAVDQSDAIEKQKSSTAIVEVIVLDINDNYPQFDERTYTVHVPEDINSAKQPVIAEVKAYDADSGSNAAIRYTLIGGNTRGHFRMDGVTGDISVVAPLDYEAFRSYRLVVRAQDGGSPARSNTTQILVNVVDINDNDPRFYTTLFQESVMENVDKDHGIVQVQAFDADGGQNGQLEYTIKNGPENMPITVDPVTGWISTSRRLDREEGALYRFSVIASDHGRPSRSASASVIITVQDVNDNDPTFSPKMYKANVAEDSSPGSPIISVTASDPDQNSRIFYQITKGNDRGKFNVISQNKKGLLSLALPLDYKQEKHYVITVTATDSGGRYDTAIVYLNVTDANTHRPIFVQTPYSASIAEDVLEGSPVLVVEATDGDVGENARITYTIDDDQVFRIDSSTGAITTAAPLNREKIPGYTISVTAQDHGNPPLSDTTDVEIVITDVNDNAPAFSQSSYASSIKENIGKGTSVVTIRASDPDQGLNGRIKYTFGGGNDGNGAFSIDSTSGTVRNKRILDRESKALYDLVAYAVDLGQPSMSSSVNIQVKVDDENDNPPRFESEDIRLYIAENSPVGSTVGEITAYDPDEGPNASIQYSIIDGIDANAFKLTTNQLGAAEITSLIEFDYESSRKKYSFTLRAESDPKRSDVSVEIWVTDVNDNAPVLSDFTIYFNNYDNYFPVGPIGKVPAHDDDVSDKLRYRFSSGNNANILLLNESTGEITPSPGLNTNVPTDAEMEVSVFGKFLFVFFVFFVFFHRNVFIRLQLNFSFISLIYLKNFALTFKLE